MDDRKFIDPAELRATDLPFIILVDDLRGFIGWAIKWHCNGNYNHIMTATELNFVESQGFFMYEKIKLERYLKPGLMLKFWKIKLNRDEIELFNKRISEDLKQPWYRKLYDFPGILGQALRIRFLQSPFQSYCSERVANELRVIPRIKNLIPVRSSPAMLNITFNQYPDVFDCVGYYQGKD